MKKAFTLIELLVVMVIAAVIMAVALPGFMSMNRGMAMRGATRSVKSTASLARQWAITHRTVTSIQLSSNTLLVVDAQAASTNESKLSDPLVFAREISVASFYYDTSANTWISTTNTEFLTTGGLKVDTTKNEGDHKITLTETNGANVVENTVVINWLTGGISIQ